MTHALDQMLTKRYTRRGLLKGTVAAGAGALALSAFGGFGFATGQVAARGPLDSDLDILNYALTLEYLESDAYAAINKAGVLTGRAKTYFEAFGAHEAAHVDAITATIRKLGGTPAQRPAGGFNFTSVPMEPAAVVRFFQEVEAVGASAYLGAAPSIQNLDVLEAALSIHANEAEHASALADLVAPGANLFAPEAFATPRTPDQVLQIVAPFLQPLPGMPSTGGGWGAGRPAGGFGLIQP